MEHNGTLSIHLAVVFQPMIMVTPLLPALYWSKNLSILRVMLYIIRWTHQINKLTINGYRTRWDWSVSWHDGIADVHSQATKGLHGARIRQAHSPRPYSVARHAVAAVTATQHPPGVASPAPRGHALQSPRRLQPQEVYEMQHPRRHQREHFWHVQISLNSLNGACFKQWRFISSLLVHSGFQTTRSGSQRIHSRFIQ